MVEQQDYCSSEIWTICDTHVHFPSAAVTAYCSYLMVGRPTALTYSDTIKLPEKNIGKTFSDISHTNVFLGQSLKAIEIRAKINGT